MDHQWADLEERFAREDELSKECNGQTNLGDFE